MVERAVADYNMLSAYEKVIVGFSGGADSSALLHYFVGKARAVVCVHINHMIRGAEADSDEAFCKSVCEKYGIELSCHRIDIPALAKERGKGIEETAREERYHVFNEELLSRGFDAILTAHNANDNTESVIFNLARGSGANGISGIKAVNGKILRPLIYASRREILEYCEKNNIEYVTDSTNNDTEYTRNYIRHKIVPMLEELNPSLNSAVARLTASLRADEDFINSVAKEFVSRNCKDGKIPPIEFDALHQSVKARVLKLVAGKNLDNNAILACVAFMPSAKCGDMINLCKGISLKREGDYAAFVETSALARVEFSMLLEKGVSFINEANVTLAYNADNEPKGTPYFTLRLDKNKLRGNLYVRSRKDGDTIIQGRLTKKLKKLLCERKIPSHLRDKIPLICDDDGIVAIPEIAVRDGARGEDIIIKFYNGRA